MKRFNGFLSFACIMILQMAFAQHVNLELRPQQQVVCNGDTVSLSLYAVSDSGEPVSISAMDVIITWDPTYLNPISFTNAGNDYSWLFSGFLYPGDLNAQLNDGDAIWTAVAQPGVPAFATPQGLKVTTFQFQVQARTSGTEVNIPRTVGNSQLITVVYSGDNPNEDITGTLSGATVQINCAPVANNDSFSVNEDTTLTVAAPGVLGNDTDPDGDTLTAVLVSGPSNGTLTLNANGSFSYTPNPNFNGTDSFTYRASDGIAVSNLATVSITVSPVNDAPVAVKDRYRTAENTSMIVMAPGVLSNDSDVDGDPLSAVLVSGPTHGTLTLNADGSFTYTPNPGFSGIDRFKYKASDGILQSNVATVRIRVRPTGH